MKNRFVGIHLDFIGFSSSLLCAIHCVALPFLLSFTSLAGIKFLNNHWVEYLFILVSLSIAVSALAHGYNRHHKKPLSLLVLGIGFVMILTGQVSSVEWVEVTFTSLGAILIAFAHLANWWHIKMAKNAFPECLHRENQEK